MKNDYIKDIIGAYNNVLSSERELNGIDVKGHFVESHYGKKIFGPFKTVACQIIYVDVINNRNYVAVTAEYSDSCDISEAFSKVFYRAFERFIVVFKDRYEEFLNNSINYEQCG